MGHVNGPQVYKLYIN